MCGIVGYIGRKKAYPILIKGLQRLEYRGYDSAGVAMISSNGSLNVYKAKGKVADLEAFCEDKDISGSIGIAHTRWATHGEPNSTNAHPHYSASGRLALIHNGIIENYATIKENLIARGIEFKSVTDTEVLVQLIEHIMLSNDLNLLEAVQVALHQVIGAYAIAILDREHPDTIICARQSSPLVVGLGEDGDFYLASDASPIAEYTDKVVYLNDGDIAVLQLGKKLTVVNVDNEQQHPKVKQIDVTLGQLEKGGYPFFMLKEIFEQPNCIRDCIRGRINVDGDRITLSAVIVARRAHRQATVREPLPHTRGGGVRLGVPLPRTRHLPRRCGNRHLTKWRDGRHPRRHRVGPQGRCLCLRRLQRHRCQHSPSDADGCLYPCGPRDWCGFHQSLHRTGHRAVDARTLPGQRAANHSWRPI